MSHMLAIAPDPWIAETKVTGTGTDDGIPSDASIESDCRVDRPSRCALSSGSANGSEPPASHTAR